MCMRGLREGDCIVISLRKVIKVVSDEKKYRSDGKEKAKKFFARRKRV